jgi:low affinity Fe/Cu permease
MFSFFVASLIIGSSSYVFVFLNMSNLLFSTSVTTIAIFGIVFISNYILFLPKERQLKQFEEYKINQNGTKDLFAILFSVFSIGIYFSVILLGKEYFEG